ncbi:pyridine nucleotide-disulfide oxidoreductase domain-containing protein 2 isoform X2 [Myiozetetes cayanensis]|uniref:pyridine nucleotide-disulfide oxidoreductase domain-containing protein 2 isoform X2 n=1 Tax=Myiozetetes cayanensis TaxID=478635 RepID=UPI0021602DF5|nr:pyridine nucleotide-disulfide oxidoreductase domain-containing protein 2 isoform X2 [Myiozetetes cayanensis]
MARHCGAMATRIQARLSKVCPPRLLQDWHPSLGLSGARLAHTGAAERLQREYDAVVIGAGHNGLVAAAYLQQAGVRTAVLEKRHVLGGAAVTEEIVPGTPACPLSPWPWPGLGVATLLYPTSSRVQVLPGIVPAQPAAATNLCRAGAGAVWSEGAPKRPLLLHPTAGGQEPSSLPPAGAQHGPESTADCSILTEGCPVLVVPSLTPFRLTLSMRRSWGAWCQPLTHCWMLLQWILLPWGRGPCSSNSGTCEPCGPCCRQILDQWFESEPLKATLATDAVIGAMASPHTPGSGYVLLHHVMGELEGRRGAWGYVAGGMGALSQAIACAATARGAHIFAEKAVCHVLLGRDGRAQGVALQDGTEVRSKLVLSNASPQITFLELTPQEQLPKDFVQRIRQVDTRSPVTKINVAVDRLPSFLAAPNARDGQPLPHHQCSIHLNCENTHLLHQAFTEATHGHPSNRPMIELCIPSALDPGLAPQGCHVVSLFTQYTPSMLADGQSWDEQARNAYADRVFDCIEDYAPGFKASVIGRDILTPPDLERIFGLPGGNIFHGGMSLDQLYFARPAPSYSGYRSPIPGLYLCGSGAHPGGGVMGAAGRNAAQVALKDFRHL